MLSDWLRSLKTQTNPRQWPMWIKIVTFGGIKLRRFLAGGYPAGMAFALYAASLATLCVALYECNRRDETLTASASGSLLFAVLSIIPFLCLLLAGWGAYFSLVRAKRAGGVLAANLLELGQIVVLVTAVPLIFFCSVAQVPAVPVVLSQGAKMFRGPLWHVTSDRRVLIVTGEFTPGIAEAVEQSLAATRSVRIVVFESPGGDVDEAMRIGRDIKAERARDRRRNRMLQCLHVFLRRWSPTHSAARRPTGVSCVPENCLVLPLREPKIFELLGCKRD